MSQKDENIKVSCKIIAEYLRRVKTIINAHKNLPTDLYITINSAHREISKETQKIRRATWRKKYVYASNISPILFASHLKSNGGLNVYRKEK